MIAALLRREVRFFCVESQRSRASWARRWLGRILFRAVFGRRGSSVRVR